MTTTVPLRVLFMGHKSVQLTVARIDVQVGLRSLRCWHRDESALRLDDDKFHNRLSVEDEPKPSLLDRLRRQSLPLSGNGECVLSKDVRRLFSRLQGFRLVDGILEIRRMIQVAFVILRRELSEFSSDKE